MSRAYFGRSTSASYKVQSPHCFWCWWEYWFYNSKFSRKVILKENLASTADQDIENIEILDASTIIVRYVQNISGTTYDFKLLAENNVVKVEKPTYDAPEIIITVEPPLLGEQDYILMVVDMKDVDGKQLQFDTESYDFTTPLFAAQRKIL